MAARSRASAVPGGRLGRARRLRRDRPRQLGAALPRHLGHRPRRRRAVRQARRARRRTRGLVELRFRHRVDELVRRRRRGHRRARRGARARATRRAASASSRVEVGDFELQRAGRDRHLAAASAATTTSCARTGRQRLGTPPQRMISGVPAHVDGRMLADHRGRRRRASSTATGCGTTSRASRTGTRSGRGTASASCPARRRCGSTPPASACPCRCSRASTRSARSRTCARPGYDHSWFVLTQKIIEKEFALSGSEQNPDLTGKRVARGAAAAPVRAPRRRCRPSWTRARTSSSPHDCASWSRGMNALTAEAPARRRRGRGARSSRATGRSTTPSRKDLQIAALRGARTYRGDRLIRAATPHRCSTPRPGRSSR